MQIEEYLKAYQPILYQTFLNALQNDKLSHAYLISGSQGTPLLEVSKFLAKSILCDDPSPLACNSCITCLRVDDNNYPDIMVLDGSLSQIKKGEVGSIEQQFQKTAFESKGIMIYILHLVENMTIEAINSLLKFLEEPGKNVYAFLTTNNPNNLLPTIISRCQTLHLKQVERRKVIDSATILGVDLKDAELLSYFFNNGELIKEFVDNREENDKYILARNSFETLLSSLANGSFKDSIYIMQKNVIPNIKTKQSARFFLDILSQSFEDIVKLNNCEDVYLTSYLNDLTKIKDKSLNPSDSLTEILKCRNILNTNVNISLLLDHLIIKLSKGA